MLSVTALPENYDRMNIVPVFLHMFFLPVCKTSFLKLSVSLWKVQLLVERTCVDDFASQISWGPVLLVFSFNFSLGFIFQMYLYLTASTILFCANIAIFRFIIYIYFFFKVSMPFLKFCIQLNHCDHVFL